MSRSKLAGDPQVSSEYRSEGVIQSLEVAQAGDELVLDESLGLNLADLRGEDPRVN